jgi:thiol-disulfide isomerase/thioredoxin
MRRVVAPLIAVVVVVVVVIGLSQASSKPHSSPTTSFSAKTAMRELKGSPAPLAAIHAQNDQILGGGLKAFKTRLAALKGHPVVINKWGSWCTPCRGEFPVLQRVAAAKGKTVAFLGVDGHDNRGEALAFLKKFPVSYPSYADPDEKIARAIQAPANYPITVFVNRKGKVVIPHSGPYESVKALEADIKRYLRA